MASPLPANNGVPTGALQPQSTWGEYNNIIFVVQQALAKMQTATLVEIKACTNNGGLSQVGFVDVLPLVNQIDGVGNPTPHTTIFNIPYVRIQGGNNAIIMDPQEGDIGMCVFASRDISKIKTTKTQGNPGSYRQYNFSDGMYLGGLLNGVPSQYVQFNSAGIKIVSPVAVTITDTAGYTPSGAILDVQSTTKPFKFPAMTAAQKNAIVSPQKGDAVFDTTVNGLSVYNGTSWS